MAGRRWIGELHAYGGDPSNSSCRVTASLCISNSTNTLLTPSSNVIFFVGDRVEGTDNTVIERLSKPDNVADILVKKLGPSVNVYIVEPSNYRCSFACYDNLLPKHTLTDWGEPLGYNPEGFPASSVLVPLLRSVLTQVNAQLPRNLKRRVPQGKQLEENGLSLGSKKCPRTILLGFSKGGVVLNQLLAELSHMEDVNTSQSMLQPQGIVIRKPRKYEGKMKHATSSGGSNGAHLLPESKEEFLRSVEEVHYVDVGLNRNGAYQTDARVLEGLAKVARNREAGLLLAFHGTPRQWCDGDRPWLVEEKNKCVQILGAAAAKPGNYKLHVTEDLYFPKLKPSLQMHFDIIDAFKLSSGSGGFNG